MKKGNLFFLQITSFIMTSQVRRGDVIKLKSHRPERLDPDVVKLKNIPAGTSVRRECSLSLLSAQLRSSNIKEM